MAMRRLTDAEWAIVGPAVAKAQEAMQAVNQLVAIIAVRDGLNPDTAVLKGRFLVVPDPMREDA